MNSTHIIDTVAEQTGVTKAEVKFILDKTLEIIKNSIAKRERVAIRGFGYFWTTRYPPIRSVSIYTGKNTLLVFSRIFFKPYLKAKRFVNESIKNENPEEEHRFPDFKRYIDTINTHNRNLQVQEKIRQSKKEKKIGSKGRYHG